MTLFQQFPIVNSAVLTPIAFWFFVPLLLTYLGFLIAHWPLHSSRDKPWYEQSRAAHSVRRVLGFQMLFWPLLAFVFGGFGPWPWGNPAAIESPAMRGVGTAFMALVAAMLVRYIGERHIFRGQYSLFQLFRSTVVYHFALGQIVLVTAVVAGAMMPPKMNASVFVILLPMLLAVLFFTCGGGLLVLRGLRLLRPADERLQCIVRKAADQVELTPPTTYLARMPAANAIAFPWNYRLAFSDGMVQCLDDAQLKSIAAHEICHLGMPTAQKITRLLLALALLVPLTLIKPMIGQFGANGILPIALGTALLIIVVQRIGRRVMQREEERADRAGAAFDEAVYAAALECVYRQNLTPANWQSPQGHPALYDRMTAAGVPPNYPKPRPPSRWIVIVALTVEVFVFLGITVTLVVAGSLFRDVGVWPQ